MGASLLAALAVALGPGAGAAGAHDALVGSDPSDAAVLIAAPHQVVLTFSAAQLAVGAAVEVTGPDGGGWTQGDAAVDDSTVTQALAPGMPSGAYQVAWRSVSADGHPVSGELSFSVDLPEASAAPEPDASAASTDEMGTDGASTGQTGPATPRPRATAPEVDEVTPARPSATRWLLAGAAVVAAALVVARLALRRGESGR